MKNATKVRDTNGALISYPAVISVRNIAGTAYNKALTQDLMVVSENKIANITATLPGNRAGGYDSVDGSLWDQYGNEITEWQHTVDYKIVESPVPPSQIRASDADAWSITTATEGLRPRRRRSTLR